MTRAGEHPLHVMVLVKQVPQPELAAALDPAGRLIRGDVPTEMNPFCRRAVSHAVKIAAETGGSSTAVTMGPAGAADVLREAAACGVDRGVHLSDRELAGSDCLATTRALVAAIGTLPPPDLVVVGRNSVDADTGTIGPMVAEALGLPFVGPALSLTVVITDGRPMVRAVLQHDDAEDVVVVRGPVVVAVAERSIAPAKAPRERWPTHTQVRTLSARELGDGPWGQHGSGTVVAAVRRTRSTRTGVTLAGTVREQAAKAVTALVARGTFEAATSTGVELGQVRVARDIRPRRVVLTVLGDDAHGRRALLGEAAELAAKVGARVVALGSADDPAELARWGADELRQVDRCDPRPLAAAIADGCPDIWAGLGPATAGAREVLARLAVRLGAGLIADAVSLDIGTGDAGEPHLIGVKPSGGDTVADIACCTAVSLATVRTGCLPLRTPRRVTAPLPVRAFAVPGDPSVQRLARHAVDDHDILDRAHSVIGVGRGVDPRHYGEIESLRARLRAELAATRPVTDAGWLPHGRQVGITARNIAPQLYVAVGIGGSANHLAGVRRAHTVLAINSDPDAAIFRAADVGIVADWRLAVPALARELNRRGIG